MDPTPALIEQERERERETVCVFEYHVSSRLVSSCYQNQEFRVPAEIAGAAAATRTCVCVYVSDA